MSELYVAAGLFEVNVPDFKQLKACRKEVGGRIDGHAVLSKNVLYIAYQMLIV